MKPYAVLQTESRDCGFSCISLLLGLRGIQAHPQAIKMEFGGSARGLSFRAIITLSKRLGLACDAVCFDAQRPDAIPLPCITLAQGGHFIVLTKRDRKGRFIGFDPSIGWFTRSFCTLRRTLDGIAIVPNEAVRAEVELPRTPAVQWRLLFPRMLGIRRLAAIAALLLTSQFLLAVVPAVAARTVDAVGAKVLALPVHLLLGYLVISAVSAATTASSSFVLARAQKTLRMALSAKLFRQLTSRGASEGVGGGAACYSTMSLATRLQELATSSILSFAFASISGTLALAMLLSRSLSLALVSLSGVVSAAVVSRLFAGALREAFAANIHASTAQRGFLLDVLESRGAIARLTGPVRLPWLERRAAYLASRAELREVSLESWQAAAVSTTSTIDRVIFAIICGQMVTSGSATIGAFVAAGLYREQVRSACLRLFESIRQWSAAETQWPQIHKLLLADDDHASKPVTDAAIHIEQVTYRHSAYDELCLEDVSLTVPAGTMICLKGPSGCGKSTLLSLVAGDAKPTSGRVRIGQQDAFNRPRGVSAVLQSDRLISGSIEENVRFFRRGISDSQVRSALADAGLAEFLNTLPGGAKCFVSEGCLAVSAGQRQRILLARALCVWSPILLLDEATSSLDVALESKVLECIKGSKRTVLMVAHRPEAWAIADRVVDLERLNNSVSRKRYKRASEAA